MVMMIPAPSIEKKKKKKAVDPVMVSCRWREAKVDSMDFCNSDEMGYARVYKPRKRSKDVKG